MGGGAAGRNTNVILVRDDVGKAKPSCFNLPSENFAYGHPGNQDLEGCREVCMRWVSHTPSAGPLPSAPDFLTFNKRATQSRVTNAKELKQYRQELDVMASTATSPQAQATPRLGKSRSLPGPMMPPGFAYGRKSRPSTPFGDVISARFVDNHDSEMHRSQSDFRAEQEMAGTQVRKIHFTAASRGHATAAKRAQMQDDVPRQLFKLKRFSRATTKIDSRRKHSDFGDEESIQLNGGERFDMDPNWSGRDGESERFEYA